MPYSIKILDQDDLIVSRGSGLIKPSEMFQAIGALKEMENYHPDMERLIIIEENASVSHIDMKTLNDFREKLHHQGPHPAPTDPSAPPLVFRAAIVCNNPLNTSITDLYVAMLENDPKVDATFMNFASIADALVWLGKPNAAVQDLA